MKKIYISPKATTLALFTENTIMSVSGGLPQFGGGAADDSGNL